MTGHEIVDVKLLRNHHYSGLGFDIYTRDIGESFQSENQTAYP
jgi:hypothetical protein